MPTRAELANAIRALSIDAIEKARSGHPGAPMGMADMAESLWRGFLKHNPADPAWPDRDRFILSKGHAGIAYAPVLCDLGFNDPEMLKTFNLSGSKMGIHLDSNKVVGVDASTGSLGQGFAVCVGMAMAAKLDKDPGRIYVLLGDGECQEGQVWEAAMAASAFKADNLVAIVDKNGLQANGRIKDRMDEGSLSAKFMSFGWHVIEINGHDMKEILKALDEADKIKGAPTAIIASTVKGKGVSFAENMVGYHNGTLTEERYKQALTELAD